jgi:hypothetical protein
MTARIIGVALVLILGLVTATATGSHAQEVPPSVPNYCEANPTRVISVALHDPNVALAIVSVEAPPIDGEAASLRVERVLDGDLDASIKTDDGTHRGCVAHYTEGATVFSSLFVAPDGEYISTLQAWPVTGADGTPVEGLTPSTDEGELLVEVPGGTVLTVDELMQAGRDFVEPTPTPLPPGVPTVGPIDTGAPTQPSGVTAPNTGTGGHAPAAGALLLGGIVVLGALGVGALALARRA